MHIFQASNPLYSRCETNVSGLPHYAVVVEQENPAAFKAQLARCAPVCMPWPTTSASVARVWRYRNLIITIIITTISVILHEEFCWLFCKTGQDKTQLTYCVVLREVMPEVSIYYYSHSIGFFSTWPAPAARYYSTTELALVLEDEEEEDDRCMEYIT